MNNTSGNKTTHPRKGRRRRNKRQYFSPGQLRGYKGQYLSAELLVKHLTGVDNTSASVAGRATAPGASAVAEVAIDDAGAVSVTVPPAPSVAPGKLVMLIGLPASGKSSISVAFEQAGWVRLNKDSLRKELYGDESILGVFKDVNGLFYRRLEEALKNGRNVLVDNTNVTTMHRKGALAMARQYGYTRITHVFLDVPLEECMRRNSLRDRKVPDAAMKELADALTWKGSIPVRSEGHLVVLKPGRQIGDFLVDRVRMHGARPVKKSQG